MEQNESNSVDNMSTNSDDSINEDDSDLEIKKDKKKYDPLSR